MNRRRLGERTPPAVPPAGGGHRYPRRVPALSVDDLVARLRARGVRMTAPRRAVLDALVEAGSHVTAEALHARVRRDHPDVSASSVYRTMDLLTEHGIVGHVHLGHGPAEYHLSTDEHAHLVCESCQAVIELTAEEYRPFAEAIEAHHGFALDLRHFAITGTCRGCLGDAARAPRADGQPA